MRKGKNKKSHFCISGILLCLALMAGCSNKGPEITSIYPRIGNMGDILTIEGTGFGEEREESFITIAGTSPTSSSYLSWSDNTIKVRVPEFGEAGLVYVHQGRKKSNPALFANQMTLPIPTNGFDTGSNPKITSIEPPSGPIGSLIVIQGSNFGSSRESSGVFFSWDAESPPGAPVGSLSPGFIEAFGTEFGYELWSEREIRVRVPDGAISGNLELRTPRGNSLPVYFEITGRPGVKTFREKKSYVLSYSVDVQVEKASIPNALYLWMPQPALSGSQRNTRLISRDTEPFVDNYHGTSLFQFIDIHPRTSFTVSLSYVADVYAIETSIRATAPVRLSRPSPQGAINTISTLLVPSEDPNIKTQAQAIIGNERNPYPAAQKIYEWMITQLRMEEDSYYGGALEALEEKRADSYRASLLFCALARAAGVPAQPVAGVAVSRQLKATRHFWAEFWLDGFGWIPLDPVFGAGLAIADFTLREDYARYYFGNLDNQRIAFSRGEQLLSQMTPWGRTSQRSREFSLQNLWEEAVDGLESYSCDWSDVTITAMYSN